MLKLGWTLFILVLPISLLGYTLNLIKFVKTDFEAPYKAEVIRGIGLITPISAITGFVKIEDN